MEGQNQDQASKSNDAGGKIIILSAPSGCGKTTLAKKLLERNPNLRLSISATTRKARGDEVDGKDYFFKNKDEFANLVNNQAFIEYAEIYGNFYGTPKDYVLRQLELGHDVLFDIDPQGAKSILQHLPDITLAIYILPPSLNTLKKRLQDRSSDNDSEIEKRLDCARAEMAESKHYHHLVTNDKLDETISMLEEIINKYKKDSDYVG